MSADTCVCGHHLTDHERAVGHGHTWTCWGGSGGGAPSCGCPACLSPESEVGARCGCLSFRAVAAAGPPVLTAEASTE